MPESNMSRLPHSRAIVFLLLVGTTIIAYWNVPHLYFTGFDDPPYVSFNPIVQSGLNWHSIRWAFTNHVAGNWHPLTMLSHMADCQLLGVAPGLHHLVNLAIHLASVLILFCVFQSATGAIWRSGFVAALFAVHPLNVESVAWIAERKSLLSTLFFLSAILTYIWYSRSPNWKRYLTVAGFFILGLLSKSMVVTLPFVLLLLDYWPLERWRPKSKAATGASGAELNSDQESALPRRRSLRFLLLEKVPLLVLSAAFCVVTVITQKADGSVAPLRKVSLVNRTTNALQSYVLYLSNMVWPNKLAAFYPLRAVGAGRALLYLACLLIVTVVAVVAARRYRFVIFGWLWYLGTLVPVIGIVQVGTQARADRYVYIPLIGIFVLLVWSLGEVAGRVKFGSQALIPAGVCAIVALTFVTRRQVLYWHDTVTLFEHAEEITGPSWMEGAMLGDCYMIDGRVDDAIREYSHVNSHEPMYPEAQDKLGMALARKGQLGEAIFHFGTAIDAKPTYVDAYNNLGAAFVDAGEPDKAAECFGKVIELNPGHASAYANLGMLSEQRGDTVSAVEYYRKSLDLMASEINVPGYIDLKSTAARINVRIGDIQVSKGRLEDARGRYIEAQRLDPDNSGAQQGLDKISKSDAGGSSLK